eukprot:9352640-Pyramimonas_sp.AAC.1
MAQPFLTQRLSAVLERGVHSIIRVADILGQNCRIHQIRLPPMSDVRVGLDWRGHAIGPKILLRAILPQNCRRHGSQDTGREGTLDLAGSTH